MRSTGILFLLVCLTVVQAGPVSHDSSAATNSPASSNKPSVQVYGQVKKPGHYDWFSGMTVIDAIQAAGGFTSTNQLVWIQRVESGHSSRIAFHADTFPYGAKKPPLLKDGDLVSVPEKIL